jgi:hypothetical protein
MRFSVVAAAIAALACQACDDGATSAANAAPTEAGPLVFARHGVPGPWYRAGATRAQFDGESLLCLGRSREARVSAPPGTGADAAYRSFLHCMEEQRWTRGGDPP